MKGVCLLLTLACYLCYTSAATVVIPNNVGNFPTRSTPTPCVTPRQWEGRFSEWDHHAATNNRYLISYDGVKKRKYVEEEMKSMRPGRRLFKFLIFLEEQVEYEIDPKYNKCSKIPIGPWRNFSIPPNALYEDQYMIGGPEGQLSVTEWSDRQPARSKETWIGGFTDTGCWPVFEIFTFDNDTVSMGYTTRFFDQTPGIKNMSVFDVPEICKSIATQSPETPTKGPGIWDKWAPNWLKKLFGAPKIDNGGVIAPSFDVPTVNVPEPGVSVSKFISYTKPSGAKLPLSLRKP